jgi:hypothetical protein
MKDHEGALVKALIAHLGGDGALQALLGDPGAGLGRSAVRGGVSASGARAVREPTAER